MDAFHFDWLGRCGSCSLVVNLTPDQVRERLSKSLTSESLWESLTSESFWDNFVGSASRFTGKIEGNSFSLRPCFRKGRAQPTLRGEVEKTESGSRIQFMLNPIRC